MGWTMNSMIREVAVTVCDSSDICAWRFERGTQGSILCSIHAVGNYCRSAEVYSTNVPGLSLGQG